MKLCQRSDRGRGQVLVTWVKLGIFLFYADMKKTGGRHGELLGFVNEF